MKWYPRPGVQRVSPHKNLDFGADVPPVSRQMPNLSVTTTGAAGAAGAAHPPVAFREHEDLLGRLGAYDLLELGQRNVQLRRSPARAAWRAACAACAVCAVCAAGWVCVGSIA